ncbi:MAG: hypothetical protein HYZ20_21320 [Burkholderiales bacterium]|nr:hypothetical protein [Burkholderiales bacterium]
MNDDTAALAAAAAVLVAEEGLEYGEAKRKAARAAGRRGARRPELPADEAVEEALREHLAVFHAETQPGELRALRELALGWLERLAPLRPHLSGAAWRGTATRRSALRIDLYCDDPKMAEIELVNLPHRFEPASLARPGAEPQVVWTAAVACRALGEPVTLHLQLHDADAQRGALQPDARGRAWRGDAAALRRLLAAEDGATPATRPGPRDESGAGA